MDVFYFYNAVRVVAIATALPLLLLRGWPDPLRNTVATQFFPRPALALFVLGLVVWPSLFYWLHAKRTAVRRSYLLCGFVLGVFPVSVFASVCLVTHQVAPPLALGVAGVCAGVLAGALLCRESQRRYG